MSSITSFVTRSLAQESQEEVMKDALRTIHRLFEFQMVAIALKDRDGKFRYKKQIGLQSEAEKAFLRIEYTPSDLFDDSTFPSTAVSDLSRFYMAESSAYKEDEIDTFSRPLLLSQKRLVPDDMLEADYVNVYIYNLEREIVGYFELGSTRSKKLPSKATIRWIEMIASLTGLVLSKK